MTHLWDMSRVTKWAAGLFTRQAVADDGVIPLPPGVTWLPVNNIPTVGVIDTPPTPAEVERAMGWLYGHRAARRKFERTRHHITYRQRDEVAHVLARLSRAYEERNDG